MRALIERTSEQAPIEHKDAGSEGDDHGEPSVAEPSHVGMSQGTSECSTDEALLEQFQQGDQGAFRELYRRYHQKVRALALGLMHDENDAREIVQEAFIRVVRHWSRFEGQAAFYTWLYRIVYNLAVDRLRRPHHTQLPIDQVDHLLSDGGASDSSALRPLDPFDACSAKEAWHQIIDAILCLPSHHRDIVMMREVQEMSYSEMAVTLGCSKGTVMSRLFHARQRLQRTLLCLHAERK
jgi:RNA polymerase sigma-70 factor, ECF subfamily